jgi:hypothetical protein
MMGQTMMVAAEKAGSALRSMILWLAVAAVMAAMMAVSASPALADHSFDSDDFGDQELESGSVEFDTDISIEGNNNDQGVGLTQFANTGNFANQQGFDG